MSKKVVRLTESQLNEIIRSAVDIALNEIDGKTLSRVPNAATTAMDNIQKGISHKTIKSTLRNKTVSNDSEIIRANEMMPRAIQSFLAPYKNANFMFFAYKRTGNPVHLLFNVDNIKKNMGGISILSGKVIFGDEQLLGDIQIEFSKDKDENITYKVFYKYKGNRYKYILTPDNRTINKWNELINELVKSQLNMNKRGL